MQLRRTFLSLAAASAALPLLVGCRDDTPITAPSGPPQADMRARPSGVDTSRLIRKFRERGGGPVFIKLTEAPSPAALRALESAGLRGLPGQRGPETFEPLRIDAVAGYLPAVAVERVASLPFVLRIESAEDVDGIHLSQDAAAPAVRSVSAYGAPTYEWNLRKVRAPEIWRTFLAHGFADLDGNGDAAAKIQILDDGVDSRLHYWAMNPWAWWLRPLNDDNYSSDQSTPYGSHGTAVAGFAGADSLSAWVTGVAPRSILVNTKVLPDSGGWVSLVRGLRDAVIEGSSVVNMSLGNCGALPPTTVRDAIRDIAARSPADGAWPSQGVTLVAAAGNGLADGCPTQAVQYPAAYDEVIAVAAIDSLNATNPTYSQGAQVEIAAPGLNLHTLLLGGGRSTTTSSGTSYAAPHVSGLIGAIRERNKWSAAFVRQRMQETATKISGQALPRDNRVGYGLINPYAILSTVTLTISGPSYIDTEGTYTWHAIASGGTGSYAYVWEYSTDAFSWSQVGTGSSHSRYVFPGESNFYLRVTATSGGASGSNSIYVHVFNPDPGGCPPPQLIC